MTQSAWLGMDLGTQSVRVMAVAGDGSVLASAAHPLTSKRDGKRHEQDPLEWWDALCHASQAVMQQIAGTKVAGLAVDATSGTILLMDESLRPLTKGLMYDDARAEQEAKEAQSAGEALWTSQSYRMQPSWALPKLLWLQRTGAFVAGIRVAHQNDFVNAKLAGRLLATDSSNALKTGLDLRTLQWPEEIFTALHLDVSAMPDVGLPGQQIGEVCHEASAQTGIPAGTTIFSGMTDGCAAQIASGATACGSWNSVVGTTLVMKGVTEQLLHDPLGVVYSHRSVDGKWLPGGASSTGAGVIAKNFAGEDLRALNATALQMGPVAPVVYPLAAMGERYPFAAPEAVGFTLGDVASRAQEFAATLQGIALIERLAFAALKQIGADTGGRFTISGGAAKSDALNQYRADILQRVLHVPSVTEGAFGMAVLAAAHESSITDTAARMVRMDRVVEPQRPFADYSVSYCSLVSELNARNWLPGSVAEYALQEAE